MNCCVQGCNKPRKVNAAGRELARCEEHQRAYWNATKATERKYAAEKNPPRPVGRPRKASAVSNGPTLAQSIRPMERKPILSPVAPDAKRVKMVLVDEESGEIWQVTAVRQHVTRRIKRAQTIELLQADGFIVMHVNRIEGDRD